MEELGVSPNSTTYTILITRFVEDQNLEVALQYLHAMKAHNLQPEGAAAQAVIILAANQGYPKLATDLAIAFETESIRKLEDSVWLACLHASASELYVSVRLVRLLSCLSISSLQGRRGNESLVHPRQGSSYFP
jgi:pentatricopeptide repeat protein